MADSSPAMASSACPNSSAETAWSRWNCSVHPHGADVEAELPVHASPVAEGELGATAAGVEDDQIGIGQAQPRLHRQVGDPALVLRR